MSVFLGAHIADAQSSTNLVEVAHADQYIELLTQGHLQGVRGGVGMMLAIGKQPLAHGWGHFVGIPVPIVVEGPLAFLPKAPPQSMGGRFAGDNTHRCGRCSPRQASVHVSYQLRFGHASLVASQLG